MVKTMTLYSTTQSRCMNFSALFQMNRNQRHNNSHYCCFSTTVFGIPLTAGSSWKTFRLNYTFSWWIFQPLLFWFCEYFVMGYNPSAKSSSTLNTHTWKTRVFKNRHVVGVMHTYYIGHLTVRVFDVDSEIFGMRHVSILRGWGWATWCHPSYTLIYIYRNTEK
jgi:hypothetical protein